MESKEPSLKNYLNTEFLKSIDDILGMTDESLTDTTVHLFSVEIVSILSLIDDKLHTNMAISKEENRLLVDVLKFVDMLNIFMDGDVLKKIENKMERILNFLNISEKDDSRELIKHLKYAQKSLITYNRDTFKEFYFKSEDELNTFLLNRVEKYTQNKVDIRVLKQIQNIVYVFAKKIYPQNKLKIDILISNIKNEIFSSTSTNKPLIHPKKTDQFKSFDYKQENLSRQMEKIEKTISNRYKKDGSKTPLKNNKGKQSVSYDKQNYKRDARSSTSSGGAHSFNKRAKLIEIEVDYNQIIEDKTKKTEPVSLLKCESANSIKITNNVIFVDPRYPCIVGTLSAQDEQEYFADSEPLMVNKKFVKVDIDDMFCASENENEIEIDEEEEEEEDEEEEEIDQEMLEELLIKQIDENPEEEFSFDYSEDDKSKNELIVMNNDTNEKELGNIKDRLSAIITNGVTVYKPKEKAETEMTVTALVENNLNYFTNGRDCNFVKEYLAIKKFQQENEEVINKHMQRMEDDIVVPLYHRILMSTEKRKSLITYIFNKYSKIIKKVLAPQNVLKRVAPYGSSVNNFMIDYGDVDICIIPKCDIFSFAPFLEEVKSYLVYNKLADIKLNYISNRYILCKLEDRETKVLVDITVHNLLPLINSNMLKVYSTIDQRFHILGIYLKNWARINKIQGAADKYLSSYALIIMLIYFLQRTKPPVLPNLQTMVSKTVEYTYQVADSSRQTNIFYESDFDKINTHLEHSPENKQTITELLVGFFEFYSYMFDHSTHSIAIHIDGVIAKGADDNIAFSIIDPFDHKHNPGASMRLGTPTFNRFVASMRREINHILSGEYVERLNRRTNK